MSTIRPSRFIDALAFTMQLHADQRRKGTTVPYIAHLLGVTSLVIEQCSTEDEAVAALLHDAVEDQGGPQTREEIRRRFGEAVVAIVDGCTDTNVTPKLPWRKRKEDYLAHIADASPSVRRVSSADKLHNARAILMDYRALGESVWDRFISGRDGTLWYYRALVEAYRAVEPTPLVDELDRVVAEIERLAAS